MSKHAASTRRGLHWNGLIISVAALLGMTMVVTMSGDSLASWVSTERVTGEFRTNPMLRAEPVTDAVTPLAVSLQWSVPDARGDERFVVERATTATGTGATVLKQNTADTSYVDNGDFPLAGGTCSVGSVLITESTCSLTQATDYWYRVSYRLGSFTSQASDWVKATTPSREALLAHGTPTTTQMALEWDQAPYAGLSSSSYVLERALAADGGNAEVLKNSAERTFVDIGNFDPFGQPYKLATSTLSTCGLASDGIASCWGKINGATSTPAAPKKFDPTTALGNRKALNIASQRAGLLGDREGGYCATPEDGRTIACWLGLYSGATVNPDINRATAPTAIYGVEALTASAGAIKQLVMASEVRCFSTTSNNVYCWGSGYQGGLADGNSYYYYVSTDQISNRAYPDLSRPVLLNGVLSSGSTITKLTAGMNYFCALNDLGEVACWGNTSSWRIDSVNPTTNRPWLLVPSTGILGGEKIVDIEAGATHLCALTDTGSMACWGENGGAQLGTGSTGVAVPFTTTGAQPVRAQVAPANVRQMSLGGSNNALGWTCVLTTNDEIACWGANDKGQIGNGVANTTRVTTPYTSISGQGKIGSLSTGFQNVCVNTQTEVKCWGFNRDRQSSSSASATIVTPTSTGLALVLSCPWGSTILSGNKCSLAPDTTYYYRVTYTLNGLTVVGDWVPRSTLPQ